MSQTMQFGDVLEAADHLSVDEKEELIDVLRKRLAAEGRKRVASDVNEARQQFTNGGCQSVDVSELLREITS